MKITFDRHNGPTYPDGRVVDEMRINLLNGEDFTIGSETSLCAIRWLFLCEGFSDLNIIFIFEGKEYPLNKYAVHENIDCFGDITIKLTQEILMEAIRLRRIEKAGGLEAMKASQPQVTFHARRTW